MLVALASAMAPGAACAEPPSGLFAKKPSAEDLLAAYPPEALRSGRDGQATLRCQVSPDGHLAACAAEAETPAGEGFGAAVLALAPRFRVDPNRPPGEISIPIRFVAPRLPPLRAVVFPHPPGEYAGFGSVGPYFPERAYRMGKIGVALLDCQVDEKARLRKCTVVGDKPEGFGFSDAARKMAEQGWVLAGPVAAEADKPADGLWRFRIDFNVLPTLRRR